MPLYAQQLLSGQLLSPFVPDHDDSADGETQQHRQRTPLTIADADVVATTRDVYVLVMFQI